MRFLLLATALIACLSSHGQTGISQLWESMPAPIIPYLDSNSRTDMVNFYNMGVQAEVVSAMGDTCAIDSLNERYMLVRLNQSVTMQLGLLPTTEGDTLICMVKSYKGESEQLGGASESVVTFYDSNWQPLDTGKFLEPQKLSFSQRPDTMSVERYNEIVRLMDPALQTVTMDAGDLSLTISPSTPFLSKKEKEQIKAIAMQRKLKWNGKNYK